MTRDAIYVIYGSTPKEMVKTLLNQMAPEQGVPREARIGIKPNLVVAKAYTSGATTCPDIVAGVIEYWQSKGFRRLVILEGSWVGDRTREAFRVCGYEQLAREYGVELIDLQQDSFQVYQADGMAIRICDQAKALDYLINIPVLKGHCQTGLTCALKNLKGCIPDQEKRNFHRMGLHRPIAYLNKLLPQHLVIVDGLLGDLDFEEGGNPVQMNRLFAGTDPVRIDAYAAQLMGYALEEIPYIGLAHQLGVGEADLHLTRIIELNRDQATKPLPRSDKVRRLARYIEERDACSACYGSLIHALQRLNAQGALSGVKEKIFIGQGYRGQAVEGVGVGQCTNGCTDYLRGCPPSAAEIIAFLRQKLF